MAYVRLSIVKPSRGQQARAEELMRKIADSVRELPGCTQSMLLKADDGTDEIARIAVYDSSRAAADAANNQHVMALRSELHHVVEPGHQERSFDETE